MLRVALRTLTLVTLLLYLGIAAQAAIIRVPQDYPTVQEAIGSAADGDTIEIADGTHLGNIVQSDDKALTIRSASGNPSACIVELYFGGSLASSPNRNFTISGITFTGLSAFRLLMEVELEPRATVTFSNCVFDPGGSGDYALQIYSPYSAVIITNCTFRNNGSVNCYIQTASISDCTFSDNRSYNQPVLNISGFSPDPNVQYKASLVRCTFENNYTGQALNIAGSLDTEIRDCRFTNNWGLYAGAIRSVTYPGYPGTLSVHNSTFVNNRSSEGGALSLWGIRAAIANSTFVGNKAGEGIFDYNDTEFGNKGGAILALNTALTIVNSTLINNQAPEGGVIYQTDTGWVSGVNSISVSNSILWGNATTTGPHIYQSSTSVPAVLRHSLIEGFPGLTDTPDADGNFSADPLFVRNPFTSGPDDLGDLHLRPASPAINTGNNALLLADTLDLDNDGNTTEPLPIDLGFKPRVNNNTVDLGVFEYQNVAPIVKAQRIFTNQDTPVNFTLSASDTDGETLTYATSQPSHGTLSGTAPNLTYTPNSGYVGADSFTFTVTDPFGASNGATVNITVRDTTAPIITLNGSNPMSINQGSTFTDPGATATDNVDGPVSVTVSGSVNTASPGTYTLTYTARDAAGNTATKTRTVNVVAVATAKLTVTTLGIARIGPLVGVVVRVTNTGTATATNIRVTGANLIGLDAFLIAPCDSFRLNPGKSQEVLLTFFPLTKGQKGTLSVQGTSSVGAFGLSQTVTIP